MRWTVLLLVGTGLLAAGCESSQDKSARLEVEAKKLAKGEANLTIEQTSKVVEVGVTEVLRDANGAAAVVELHNTGAKTLVAVPVLVDVQGKGGESLFKNDAAGSEASLVSAALLEPDQTLFWVNDQVVVAEQPAGAEVKVGTSPEGPAEVPEIVLSAPKLEVDETSGTAAVGRVENRSAIEQRELVIYAVARKGAKIVAAGRGQIPKLKPGADAPYTVFFIGDATGAELTLAAPPTVLEAGS